MKQIYHFTGTAGKQQSLKAGVVLLLMGVMLTLLPTALQAQVLQPFTQRTSDYSPDMPIYHIKGDYTMIGNTSVTFNAIELNDDCDNHLNNSSQNDDENYNRMKYVDVDGTTFSTINSSTAQLTFSDEFGANPACSEVVYAGLYWTGRTNRSYVSRTTTTEDINIYSGETGGGYTLTITQNDNDRIFTFTKPGSDSVVLTMRYSNNRYYVYNGDNQIYSSRDHNSSHLAEFITTDGSITEDNSIPLNDNYRITKLYWNSSTLRECYATIEVLHTTTVIDPWFDGSSQYYLNKIKIKHANESTYTEVTASPTNVYGGTSASSYIYAAYAEVTDYVRRNGLGDYTVADLVTDVGTNDNTGRIGCWGMVVVYENSKMKWRDITLFDGFANVENGNNVTIPISGFKTVQVGDVNMKLGMMAAEGDRGITGDRCGILKQADGAWQYLYHAGHSTQNANNNNFFNSSIETGGNDRHPNYVNNTGIDIAMFNIPNENNEVLDNEQTNTSFRFTSTGDLYFPFCFVMGVDAYIPEAEALSGVMNIDEDDITIDSQTGNYLIKPGQEITFAVEVKNFGTEDIVDAKLEIPLPSTIVYYRTAVEYVHPGINIEGYFDAERYANGVAGWNIDYIPSGDPNQVYARVLLTVKVTDDCYVLASTDEDCELAIEVNGTLEGISYVNRVYFKKESFISGFVKDVAGCNGNAIRNDIKVVVDKEDYVNNHCQDRNYTVRLVNVCGNAFNATNPIPFMDIYALYPQGSRFFNATTGEEYTAATGFPISLAGDNASSAKLIHVQPTSIYSAACTSDLRFILDPDGNSFSTPTWTDLATYCLDAQEVNPLSSHITSPDDDVYFRFYKERSNSAVAYVDIVPPTDVVGTYTYYVRQFRKNAIGCEDENFYGPINIVVVSPITFTSSEDSPSCIGEEVTITGLPEGGTWSWNPALNDQIRVDGNELTIVGEIAGTYTVTYIHESLDGSICPNITERSYTHQIAATTNPGTLQRSHTICQGAQIEPLRIENHIGHVERWERTTDLNSTQWDIIPNNTSSISSADLGELAAGTYYFRALVKDGNCEAVWTNTVTITVTNQTAPNPPTVTSPQYACIGTDYTILPSGGNYEWYEQAIGGWPSEDANDVRVTDEWITRYVSEVNPETHCVSNRALVVVRPNLEPGEINSTGQRECELNQAATTIGTFSAAETYDEGTVEYQWYVQENGGALQEIDGETSATFTPSAYMSREGEYIFTRKVKNSTCENWQQSRGEWRLVVGKPDASIEAVPGHATICQNGDIELRLRVPASTAYSYQWYKDGDSITNATGHEYIATEEGTYTARVTHKASGCSATTPQADAIEVKYDDDAPTATSVDTTLNGCSIADAPEAYNNVIAANASEFGFNISDGITPEESLTLDHTEAETETEDLPTGVCYQLVRTYTVTDQCGFSTTFTHTINVKDTEAPSIGAGNLNTTLTSTNCIFTLPDFTAAVREISSDNCTAQNNLEITQNPAGTTYTPDATAQTVTVTVTVKDACGNTSTKNIDVTIPAALQITSLSSASNCYGQADGYINYTFSGGTPNYTVSIGTATNDNDHATAGSGSFTNLADGSYTVTVTDGNNCVATATTTIEQITPTLIITAQSNTWNYDGQSHTQPSYNVTYGEDSYTVAADESATLVNGDVVTATVSGSITNAGTEDNTVTGVTVTREGTPVTCYYNIDKVAGTLTIEPKPVTITAGSASKQYDGTALTNDSYTNTALAAGDVIESVNVEGSQTVVGSSDNVPSAAVIKNTAGEDVTASYEITYTNGTLEVTKKAVTITAASDTKVYDGTELTKNSYTNSALAAGDAIESVTVTGSQTVVGSSDNVPSDAVIMDGEEDVTSNYNITYLNGTLTVTPRSVTLTSATDSKIYDGTPLTNSTVTVGGDGFVTGEGATYDVTGTITNVGSCSNAFTYTLNSNTDANNYTITKIEGTLTILIDSVPPCIGCDPIAGVSCETIGNQTRTNDENRNYYTHSGTAWDVNATDNSGAIPVMTWSLTGVTTASGNSTLDGQRFNVGVTTVTWTATDVTGNPATCQFTVTVTDDEDPVISCPSDIAGIACITDVPAAYTDYAAFQTAGGELTDNDVVDYESFALVDADTNGTCPTTITRTYYIEDTTGNSATCKQVITIKDSIAPALKVADSWPDNITGQDNCFANRNISGLMSNDAVKALYSDCNTFTVSHEDTVTGNNCGWTVTRTYTITDLCDNIVMPKPTMSVSGSDQTAPYIMPTVLDRTLTATGCEFRIPDMREEVRAISSDGCTGNSALTVEQPSAGMQVYPQVIARDTNVIIRVTDACGNYSLKSVKITIPAKVVITATATPASICNGETAQLSTTVTNVVGAASYVWEPSTGLNSTTIYNPTTTLTATGASDTVTYTVMVTDANGCTATATTFVTVNPKVVMDTVADQAICHGSAIAAVNFTTPITDGSVVYNWSRDNDNIGGLAMSGTGNIAAATLTNTTNTAQTTTITVTPVYANNGKTCTDETITFTITVYPKVVMDTVADQAICHGSAITAVNFSSDLSGGDITYTWRRTNSNIGGLDMSDTGNIPATVLTNTTNTVQVDTITVTPVYTNNGNECTDETITFTITVNPKVVMNDVADQAICHGSAITAVNFTTPITDGSVVYNWSRNNENIEGLEMSGIGNIAAATLTNTTNTAQVDTITVTPVYTNNGNECTDESITFTITVNPKVVMDTVADQAICHGSEMAAVNFTTPITDGSVVYNWSRNNDNIAGLAMSGIGNIPATVLTNTTNTAQVDTITVTPVYTNNEKTCTDESITFTITVNPKVVMDTVANQAICHGSAITAVNFTTPITDGSVVYNWSRDNDSISGLAMSGTGNIPATVLTNTTNTAQVDTITVTPVYTNNGNECTDESITFTITVNPKVVMNDVADQAICHGSAITAVNFTTPITDGSVVYNWSRNNENIEGLEMSGTGNIAAATLTNTTNTAQTTTITVTPVYTNNGNECTDESITFTITVNPEVVMNTVEDWTLCVGETSPEYVYTSTITDGTVTYGWSNDNSAIGLAASGTGNLPSFVAANATPANLIAEVKVAPTYTNNGISCQGDSINFHITVRPSITTPGNVAFSCPADTTVVLSYSECEQFVNIGYPEFVNHMKGMTVNITNDAPEGNIFPEGTTVVTWTATDECGDTLTCTQNVVIQFPPCGDTIADFDGYRYSSVRIGCQCWTGENARSEHYSDGTPVDNFRYYNDSDSLENIYGKLYTWYTAVRVPEGDDTAVPADSIDPLGNSYVQGICPEGWALPTVDEYMLMIANSGDATHAKDGSNLYWLPGYEGQPPFSGFDAYGAGKYNEALARYEGLLGKTYFWTTLNVPGSETATTVEINYYCAEGLQTELSKGDGVSIRCIRKR